MRAVLQRVTRASVSIDGEIVGSIGPGLLVLLGVADGDTPGHADRLAAKVVGLRVFADPSTSLKAGSPAPHRFSRSLAESGPDGQAGEALVVSQFTLLADVRNGRRLSFLDAAAPDVAAPLVERFSDALRALSVRVATGRFGAHMLVELENDGPVTLVIDTADLGRSRRG